MTQCLQVAPLIASALCLCNDVVSIRGWHDLVGGHMHTEGITADRVGTQERSTKLAPARTISTLGSRATLCVLLLLVFALMLCTEASTAHQVGATRFIAWFECALWTHVRPQPHPLKTGRRV